MRIKELFALGLMSVAVAGAGCHAGATVTQPQDAHVFDLALDLPPGCPPATANENGVGLACTKGGNQCKAKGLTCTCDMAFNIQLNGVPCICTIVGINTSSTATDPCSPQASGKAAGFCGSNATCCPYMTEGYFCSPDVCLPGGSCINFTPADAGTSD